MIVFLDIDGVLNCSESYRVYDRPFVHPHQIRELNALLSLKPHVRLILVSNWRLLKPLPMIEEDLRQTGFAYPIDGCTGMAGTSRGVELRWWMEFHKFAGERYVVLDDRTDYLPDQVRVSPNPMLGMSAENWQLARDYLTGERSYARPSTSA